MSTTDKTRVAVLRGGPSVEYEISMQTGKGVLEALKACNFATKDIIISKSGQWLCNGFVKTPEQALVDIDVVFIALHGAYGEDGTVQRILERLAIPYTGTRSFASTIAMNKVLTKEFIKQKTDTVKMAPHMRVSTESINSIVPLVASIRELFGPEYIIKPIGGGSSIGTMIATAEQLPQALEKALQESGEVIVEKRIIGKEATVGILENFRNEKFYQFPAIEIVPPSSTSFFSADVKYTGETQEICPGRFHDSQKEELLAAAKTVHEVLELRQYSRSDFIVAEDLPGQAVGVYFLEVNTLPKLDTYSTFVTGFESVGSSRNEIIKHLIQTV